MAMQTEEEKAAIAKKYPKMIILLQNGYCVFCDHRGKHRGCSFGILPVGLDGNGCKYFRMWGDCKREAKASISDCEKVRGLEVIGRKLKWN